VPQDHHKHMKSNKIGEIILGDIMRGRYTGGSRIPNERELARQYGVSRPTVSKALQELERRGLVERRPGSGTFVREPSMTAERRLGLLVPRLTVEPTVLGHFVSLYSAVVSEMARQASSARYLLLMSDLPNGDAEELVGQARRITRQLIDLQVWGVFFMPLDVGENLTAINEELTEEFDRAGIAVTLLDRDLYETQRRSRFDLVGIDNKLAAYTLTRHLIKSGCCRIDFVGSGSRVSSVRERLAGYRQALTEAGLSVVPERIHIGRGEGSQLSMAHAWNDEGVVDALLKTVRQNRSEALVCENDRFAALVLRRALAQGLRVPDDLRIVGFDDEPFAAHLEVPLTTMRQPAAALGAEAIRTMLHRLEVPDMPARDIRLASKLVVRQSCGVSKTPS